MNKLLEQIKENDEEFSKKKYKVGSMWLAQLWQENKDRTKIKFSIPYEVLEDITQSRIKELEALVEIIKEKEQKPIENSLYVIYNQAADDLIKLLQDTINQLKTN